MSRVLENATNQITQPYKALTHKGIDLVKYKGQTCNVIAHSSGKVVFCQTGQKNNTKATGNASYGNCVKIKHDNGYYTLYAHLKSVSVKLGDTVQKGQIIGYMGNTGKSYGPHLHFEVRNKKDVRINPTPYIDADLPNSNVACYQVYDNKKKKWLSYVNSGTSNYAGNKGNAIGGVRITNLTYQAHDMVKNRWLPKVSGNSDFAGNLGNNIDAVRIFGTSGYRVYDNVKKAWLPYVYIDTDYAGNLGHSIGAIQIK